MPNEQSPLPLQCWETVVTAHQLLCAQQTKNPFLTVPSWLICTAIKILFVVCAQHLSRNFGHQGKISRIFPPEHQWSTVLGWYTQRLIASQLLETRQLISRFSVTICM